MNYLEKQLEICERRIKRVRENPAAGGYASSALLYELERDLALAQMQAFREGRPIAACFYTSALPKAMGFEFVNTMMTADRCRWPAACLDAIREQGYPDDACDRTIVSVGMGLRNDMPPFSMILGSNFACDAEWVAFNALGYHTKAPVFQVDIPFDRNEDTLRYVTEQIREFVAFAEREVPGVRYDEAKLIELQELDRQALGYLHDMYELRKRVPCPIRGADAFRLPYFPSAFPDPHKGLEYYRLWRDEMAERAARGGGAVADEKLRMLWNVSGPYHTDCFAMLEKKGVAVPFFNYGIASRLFGALFGVYGDEQEYGRKLSPLEEEARLWLGNTWCGRGERWIESTLTVCRDLKLDAIVNFLQSGCTTTLGLAKVLADRAEAALGIPTLHLEGRQMDTIAIDTSQFNQKLEDFVDVLLLARVPDRASELPDKGDLGD